MNWLALDKQEALDGLLEESKKHPVLIFKHSTRCSISAAALDRLDRQWEEGEMHHVKAYFLDLIRFREVSNLIAERLGVFHQSPQAILLRAGQVTYEASHFGIDYREIKEASNISVVSN
ncbi:MAG: bacillithiol system redox-active protein YtxJ [Bacteroidota bacterium]